MNNNYILGLDCSTVGTGWCIVDKDTFNLIDYGCFKVDTKDISDAVERIKIMALGVKDVIEKYNPSIIIEEDVTPSVQNSVTVKQLGTLKGIMLGLALSSQIEIKFILPNVWQSPMGILKSKGSTKKQSVDLVNERYNADFVYKSEGSKFNEDDITDSINMVRYYLGDYKKFGKKSKI